MQIKGVVVQGKQEARTLGYPTANIEYSSKNQVESGVWTCWITIDSVRYEGLAVVGMWKLKTDEPSLEVHILNFHQELYGQSIEVTLGTRLRPLAKFEGVEKLKQQIQVDIEQGREWFKKNS